MTSVLAVAVPGAARAEEPEQLIDGVVIERDTVDIAPADSVKLQSIDIDNRLGDVKVIGHDGPGVTVSVVKRAPDAETLDRLKVNLTPDPKGRIEIKTALLFADEARPLANGTVWIEMTVEVPRSAAVSVKAWNGKLEVSDVEHGASVTGNDADITVTDVAGDVTTNNNIGKQQLSDVKGAVTAGGTSGEMSLEGVIGDSVAVRLHDGVIKAKRIRSKTVKITSTFGDITFQGEILAGGSYEFRSYKGNVTVLTGGASFKLNAYSREGDVESRVELAGEERPEAGRLVGTYGPSRKKPALLKLHSTAGNVVVGLMNE
jgi:DUF4097 and DUF4098 domain-containing protein YvlB